MDRAGVEEVDISRAVHAYRWAEFSRAVARLIWLFGVPLSAWALASWFLEARGAYTFSASLQLAVPVYIALFGVVLFGLNFSILSLRPLLAVLFVVLGALPAGLGWGQYLLNLENEVWESIAYSLSYSAIFAFPFAATFVYALPLSPEIRALARPAPPMNSPLALAREMFSVWPGMKRSFLSRLGASTLHYAAALPVSLVWLVMPPLVFLLVSLAPLFLLTHGAGEVAAQASVVIALIWLAAIVQTLLRSGARWLTRASYDDQVKRDQRAPILFLRSFQDDQVSLRDPSPVVRLLRAAFTLGFGRRRLDHILIERFSRYGPALALGSPGEKQLPFGAARVYATHESWKDKVAEIAERARSVILVTDRTPGVEWEIKTFMTGAWREKTLFVCAPGSGDIRGNPVMAARLEEAGVPPGGAPIVAGYARGTDGFVLLRATPPIRPETLIVALQAFFREQEARAGGDS